VILRATTRSKIENETKTLALEFKSVPRALIAAEVEATTSRLLEQARFDDYIPVLVYRYAREALRGREPSLEHVEVA
jgi:hypothetical protein